MQLDELESRVKRSRGFAAAIALAVAGAYVAWFWLVVGAPMSREASVWGQFGDYVGGLLNPLIAYLAFYWLTQSVLLQKEELADTKRALRDAADAQLKQEQHAGKTAKINALNTLLASHNNDISNLRQDMEFVSHQLRIGQGVYSREGRLMNNEDGRLLLAEISDGLQAALQRRHGAMEEVTVLLRDRESDLAKPS